MTDNPFSNLKKTVEEMAKTSARAGEIFMIGSGSSSGKSNMRFDMTLQILKKREDLVKKHEELVNSWKPVNFLEEQAREMLKGEAPKVPNLVFIDLEHIPVWDDLEKSYKKVQSTCPICEIKK